MLLLLFISLLTFLSSSIVSSKIISPVRFNQDDSNNLIEAKIAKPHQFPYQVYLTSTVFPYTLTSTCSGSLISKDYVLTAAHCLYVKKVEKLENGIILQHENEYAWVWETEVLLGAHNRANSSEPYQKSIYVPAVNFKMHNDYRPSEQHNDIALVKLTEEVHFNEYIQIVKLPKRSMTNLFEKSVIYAGWGMMNTNKRENPFELRYANFKVIDYKTCRKSYNNVIEDELHVCVDGQYNGNQICGGDSGSALVLKENDTNDDSWTQVGLASFGFNCGKKMPFVFTRISNYLDWISQHTGISIRD